MPADRTERAPLRPAVHLAPGRGWMNDPNGLCVDDGVWHAFYQHDPDTDVHGRMHWGHATSGDLLRWDHQPIALAPDELGVIYSGCVVVDHDDTAGFGAGAMVAVFTHHLDGLERQSLAFSLDHGLTWTKYAHNPVLAADERDFRDPKVFRRVVDGTPSWVMSLAVGRRIDFYRSLDLRSWEFTGSYSTTTGGRGPWECPDLVELPGSDTWLLTFGVFDAGPFGHGATMGVLGDFDGSTFDPIGEPEVIDHGPDFYAAQSFSGAPDGAVVVMGWLNSWRYAISHPSAGRRGILSLPRRIGLDAAAHGRRIVAVPAVDLRRDGVAHAGSRWGSVAERALHVAADGDVEIVVTGSGAPIATVRISDGAVSVERHEDVADGYAQIYRATIERPGPHEIVVDHGTIEIFAGGGSTTMSALVFPGPEWSAHVDGPASLTVV